MKNYLDSKDFNFNKAEVTNYNEAIIGEIGGKYKITNEMFYLLKHNVEIFPHNLNKHDSEINEEVLNYLKQ